MLRVKHGNKAHYMEWCCLIHDGIHADRRTSQQNKILAAAGIDRAM